MKRFFNHHILSCCLIISIFVVVAACARMSSPTGGLKDTEPPIPLKSKPVNYTTNFKGEKIIIQFNEYVTLKNVRQELLVSPPLKEKPVVKMQGRNVIIKINNELKDSTTYNFNFYNSIADLNEGNALPNFQFAFSTGNTFDSLYLGGILQNAFNYKSEAANYVMLYEQFSDSVPRKTIPDIIAKTDESGNFFLTNIKDKPYHIFALKDLNNNLKFDLPNESIAFSDSMLRAGFKEITTVDTLQIIRSISPDRKDTVFADSIITSKKSVTTVDNIRLFLFTEDFANQYFKEVYRPERQQIILAFNRAVDSNYSVVPLSDTIFSANWFVEEKTQRADSFVYWISDSLLFKRDSLKFQVNYTLKDSNLNDYVKTDTILAFFETEIKEEEKPKEEKNKGSLFNMGLFGNKEKEVKKDSVIKLSELTFTSNAKSPFELNLPIEITARFPIIKTDVSKISFRIFADSIKKPVKFDFSQDSLVLRKFMLDFKKSEDSKYELLIPAGTFTDIYGNSNDTLKYTFNTRTLDYYSNLTLKIKGVKMPSYIQMMDEKENILNEQIIDSDTSLVYKYLSPKKYLIKLFTDNNLNGKWDTGNLKTRTQPEPVFYFPQPIEVKSSWDQEYDWELIPVTPAHLKKEKKGDKKAPKETQSDDRIPGNYIPQSGSDNE